MKPGAALNALISMDGREAYDQMLKLSRDQVVGEGANRLRELAYEMAERQSERPAWSSGNLRTFGATRPRVSPWAPGSRMSR